MIKTMADSPLLLQLEKEIALLLLDKLEDLEITPERAAQIARFILHSLPKGISDGQILTILPKLDDEFTELSGIVHKHLLDYEQKNTQVTLENVRELMQQNNFQQASELMKKYLTKKL